MEGGNFPPPVSQPGIGESTKLKSTLDIMNISKILALVIGIVGFLIAAWNAISLIFGDVFAVPSVMYWILTGIFNLILYTKIPEYEQLIRSRRYGEAKDAMLLWAILGIIFGFIVGLLLLLVIFLYLEELQHSTTYQAPPPPPQAPQ